MGKLRMKFVEKIKTFGAMLGVTAFAFALMTPALAVQPTVEHGGGRKPQQTEMPKPSVTPTGDEGGEEGHGPGEKKTQASVTPTKEDKWKDKAAKNAQERCEKATDRLDILKQKLTENFSSQDSRFIGLINKIDTLLASPDAASLDATKVAAVKKDVADLKAALAELSTKKSMALDAITNAKNVQCATTPISAAQKQQFKAKFNDLNEKFVAYKKAQQEKIKGILAQLKTDLKALKPTPSGEDGTKPTKTTTPTAKPTTTEPTDTPENQ